MNKNVVIQGLLIYMVQKVSMLNMNIDEYFPVHMKKPNLS